MTLPGQRVQTHRYQVIPRTLCFLLDGDELLLIRIGADRGAWAGLLNGVGGHIEAGENPHAAAIREIQEETGISPRDLRFCGIIIVDTGSSPGIGMHVFVGTADARGVTISDEGELQWIPLENIAEFPLVTDLPILIPRALEAYHDGKLFCGLTTFDAEGHPSLHFLP